MFPSTAAAPASALPSLRHALRQAAELTVAFATLESYTLEDVLPARPAPLRAVPDERAVVGGEAGAPELVAPAAITDWATPAGDWLAEVRPICAGARTRPHRPADDDANGTPAVVTRAPRTPRRPDAKLAAAAKAAGWPVAGPRLVTTPTTDVGEAQRARTVSTPPPALGLAEVTARPALRREQDARSDGRARRPRRVASEQLSLLG